MRIRQGILWLLFLGVAASARAMTADELIAKNIQAKGGMDKIKAVQSSRMVGRMEMTGDFELQMALTQTITRSGKIREEATLQGLTQIQAWDGKEGWQIQPFGGRKDPEKLAEDDVKELQDDADIDGPLVDYKAKGHQVEFLGTEDVDGTEAYKLKVTLKSGDLKYYYLDPDYFLEIRITTRRIVRGTEREFEMDLGNYEQVDGIYVPLSLEIGPKGAPKSQKVTVERVEFNQPVNDAIFSFPATPAH